MRIRDPATTKSRIHATLLNWPREKATGCSLCHRDMYLATDIFDHDLHEARQGHNASCQQCHLDPSLPKLRENTKPCLDCHQDMRAPQTLIQRSPTTLADLAPGYMDAMHGLCVDCHLREGQAATPPRALEQCRTCHTLGLVPVASDTPLHTPQRP